MRLQRAFMIWTASVVVALVLATSRSGAQAPEPAPSAAAALDSVLDLYVRDGYVYYRALKQDRGRLDRVVAGLGSAVPDRESREGQVAFWLNAYNALVLKTVVDAYPIAQRSTDYPAHSVRQVPGAFDKLTHRVAGRALTLDQIEQTVLPVFGDPRAYFALGRGAVGGGRLRSEAFSADQLDRQLADVASECASRPQCLEVDVPGDRLKASAIFSWRERDFVSRYADSAPGTFSARGPLERAVIAFVSPRLLEHERALLTRNAFRMEFRPFDWTLNDLAARPVR